jgi:UDP-glucose-4-epimerase GalE
MHKNPILVTGGAGYIGSHTSRALFNHSYTPIVFDNLSTGHESFVKWGPLIKADLLNKASIVAALNTFKPRAIIHFAASSIVSESVKNPSKYYENNVIGSFNLLEAIKETSIIPLIFSSTCAVYGNPQFLPLTEEHPKDPISPYGSTKHLIEQMIKDYAKAYNMPYAILRYFNAAGASIDGQIGEMHEEEGHLIPLVVETALNIRDSIKVFGSDFSTKDGTASRDFIHVEDLATYHVLSLEHLLNKKENIILNLGTGKAATVKEIIDQVEKIANAKVRLEYVKRREGDPQELLADPKKCFETLGYKPAYSSLTTILETALQWHKRTL